MVPHLSTRQAQWCLTSEFGWDPVYPRRYDRMMKTIKKFNINYFFCNFFFICRFEKKKIILIFFIVFIIRSYLLGYTGSHLNSEVKQEWAYLVLWLGTTRESWVLYVFFSKFPEKTDKNLLKIHYLGKKILV